MYQLKASKPHNSFYKNCLSLIPEGVALISQENELLFANKQLKTLIKCNQNFLISRIFSLSINQKIKPKFEELDYLEFQKTQQLNRSESNPNSLNNTTQMYKIKEDMNEDVLKRSQFNTETQFDNHMNKIERTQKKHDSVLLIKKYNGRKSLSCDQVKLSAFIESKDEEKGKDAKSKITSKPMLTLQANQIKDKVEPISSTQDFEQIIQSIEENIQFGTFDTGINLGKCTNVKEIYHKIFTTNETSCIYTTQQKINNNTTMNYQNKSNMTEFPLQCGNNGSYSINHQNSEEKQHKPNINVKDISIENKISKLEELDQYKTKMLSSVSHELRTPLNCSITMLERLQELISPELNQECLEPALSSQKLLLSLINDILDFSQINAGKFSFSFVRFTLNSILSSAIQLFQMQACIKKIKLSFEFDDAIPKKITNDPNRLRQILINLIGNSLKFTKKGGIKIVTKLIKADPPLIQIDVQDTGIGIPKAQQNKIFQMFGKVETKESKTLNSQGCGLGLAISNSLAHGIGPDNDTSGLRVNSIENEGSIFSFYIVDKAYGQNQQNSFLEESDIEMNIDDSMDNSLDITRRSNSMVLEGRKKSQSIYNVASSNSIDERFLQQSIKAPAILKTKLHTYQLNKNKGIRNSIYGINKLKTSDDNFSGQLQVSQKQKQRAFSIGIKQLSLFNPNYIINSNSNILQQLQMANNKNNFQIQFKRFIDKFRSCSCPQALIVDDNQFNIYAFNATLQNYFSNIECCSFGNDCLDFCEKMQSKNLQCGCTSPCIIFMDIQMPGKSGNETTEELLQDIYNGCDVQPYIVGCSADNNIQDQDRAIQCGMKSYIVKPKQESFIISENNFYNKKKYSDLTCSNQQSENKFKKARLSDQIFDQLSDSRRISDTIQKNKIALNLNQLMSNIPTHEIYSNESNPQSQQKNIDFNVQNQSPKQMCPEPISRQTNNGNQEQNMFSQINSTSDIQDLQQNKNSPTNQLSYKYLNNVNQYQNQQKTAQFGRINSQVFSPRIDNEFINNNNNKK